MHLPLCPTSRALLDGTFAPTQPQAFSGKLRCILNYLETVFTRNGPQGCYVDAGLGFTVPRHYGMTTAALTVAVYLTRVMGFSNVVYVTDQDLGRLQAQLGAGWPLGRQGFRVLSISDNAPLMRLPGAVVITDTRYPANIPARGRPPKVLVEFVACI